MRMRVRERKREIKLISNGNEALLVKTLPPRKRKTNVSKRKIKPNKKQITRVSVAVASFLLTSTPLTDD